MISGEVQSRAFEGHCCLFEPVVEYSSLFKNWFKLLPEKIP